MQPTHYIQWQSTRGEGFSIVATKKNTDNSAIVPDVTSALTQAGQLTGLYAGKSLRSDIEAFLTDRRVVGLSPKSLKYYTCELNYFATAVERRGVTQVEDVTAGHIREYLLELGKSRNLGGIHAMFRAIRAFIRWWRQEYAPENWHDPTEKIKVRKSKLEPLSPIELASFQKLLSVCDNDLKGTRDKAILLTLLDSGLRANELLGLDIGDFDMKSGRLSVRVGKGGKFRVVFVGNKTRKAILHYLRKRGTLQPTDPLWEGTPGQRFKYDGLYSRIRLLAKQAKVPVSGPHSFRRAFALLSLRNGMDVYSLQKLMGHSDLTVLRRYLAQADGDLQNARERSGPVDNIL